MHPVSQPLLDELPGRMPKQPESTGAGTDEPRSGAAAGAGPNACDGEIGVNAGNPMATGRLSPVAGHERGDRGVGHEASPVVGGAMKPLSQAGEMLARIGKIGSRERPVSTAELQAKADAALQAWRAAHPEVQREPISEDPETDENPFVVPADLLEDAPTPQTQDSPIISEPRKALLSLTQRRNPPPKSGVSIMEKIKAENAARRAKAQEGKSGQETGTIRGAPIEQDESPVSAINALPPNKGRQSGVIRGGEGMAVSPDPQEDPPSKGDARDSREETASIGAISGPPRPAGQTGGACDNTAHKATGPVERPRPALTVVSTPRTQPEASQAQERAAVVVPLRPPGADRTPEPPCADSVPDDLLALLGDGPSKDGSRTISGLPAQVIHRIVQYGIVCDRASLLTIPTEDLPYLKGGGGGATTAQIPRILRDRWGITMGTRENPYVDPKQMERDRQARAAERAKYSQVRK